MNIRIIASLVVLSVAIAHSRADEPLKADDENLKTYTPSEFNSQLAVNPKDGQLVRIKFQYRISDVSNGPKGVKMGVVTVRDLAGQVSVIIPAAALEWFEKIPRWESNNSETLNVKSFVAYGRLTVNGSGRPALRLVGNEIKHDDLAGDSVIWHSASNDGSTDLMSK